MRLHEAVKLVDSSVHKPKNLNDIVMYIELNCRSYWKPYRIHIELLELREDVEKLMGSFPTHKHMKQINIEEVYTYLAEE